MEKSEKFAFNLPSTESDDIVDVDLISYNFRVIDEKIPSNDDLKNINIEIDQTYSPESENAQSGIAVAEALKNVNNVIKGQTEVATQINLKGLNNMSPIEHELKVQCFSSNATTDFPSAKVFAYNQLIWDKSEEVSGGLTLGGGIYNDANLTTTGYIKVTPGKVCRVTWAQRSRWANLYDINKEFVTQITPEYFNTNSYFTIPSNVEYMRVTSYNNDICNIAQGDFYTPNAEGIINGIASTDYETLISLTDGVLIQVEYNLIEFEKLAERVSANSQQITTAFDLLNAIQTMSINVDRPTGGTITVEPETAYIFDSGSNDNLISFTQDGDNNIFDGRVVLMVVGKEYEYKNRYTLAYVFTLKKGSVLPTTGMWSFYARNKETGYNTKITFPTGSSVVKIKKG